ncbi:MAG: hypothetical protein IPK83_05760 [Planctomycetes bacterium]|nr:hypothetical protein [Planctomycetota bacterium]
MAFYCLDTFGLYQKALTGTKLPTTQYMSVDPVAQGLYAAKCSACDSYLEGFHWKPPYRVDLELRAGVFGDIAFGPHIDILISDAFRNIFHQERMTGCSMPTKVEVRRVKKRGKPPGNPPDYYLTRVQLSNVRIDVAASGIRRDEAICPECLTGGILDGYDRIIVEPDSWTGEDIFIAKGLTGTIICSQRFYDVVARYELQNVPLLEAELCKCQF